MSIIMDNRKENRILARNSSSCVLQFSRKLHAMGWHHSVIIITSNYPHDGVFLLFDVVEWRPFEDFLSSTLLC